MTYITWNVSNWITVCLMVFVGSVVLGLVGVSIAKVTGMSLGQAVSSATPTVGHSSSSTATS